MNINKHTKTRSGFTLIELLTVIAIIGILAGILIPTIGLVRKNASKAKSSSELRQIALAYNAFATSTGRPRTITNGTWSLGGTTADSVAAWGQVVADLGGLNDAAVYFIDSANDVTTYASGNILPQSVLSTDAGGSITVNTDWTNAANVISYNAALNIGTNARGPITPVIWTKGYNNAVARWNTGSGSPWEGDGGHIAFLDGHVSFYVVTTGELALPNGNVANDIEAVVGGASNIL